MSRFFYIPFFMSTTIYTQTTSFAADSITPVGLYFSLRNKHRFPCLLESNDYHSRSNSKSFIGLDPILSLTLHANTLILRAQEKQTVFSFESAAEGLQLLQQQLALVQFYTTDALNGFLSYFSFEYAQMVEGMIPKTNPYDLPLAQFTVFKTLIVLDHFRDTGTVFHNALNAPEPSHQEPSDALNDLLFQQTQQPLPFECTADEQSTQTDEQFLTLVDHA